MSSTVAHQQLRIVPVCRVAPPPVLHLIFYIWSGSQQAGEAPVHSSTVQLTCQKAFPCSQTPPGAARHIQSTLRSTHRLRSSSSARRDTGSRGSAAPARYSGSASAGASPATAVKFSTPSLRASSSSPARPHTHQAKHALLMASHHIRRGSRCVGVIEGMHELVCLSRFPSGSRFWANPTLP